MRGVGAPVKVGGDFVTECKSDSGTCRIPHALFSDL